MAVERFRTFEDARRALWLEPGEARILERLQRLSALAHISRDQTVTPGVTRFRTIEEAKERRATADHRRAPQR
jgi:hypothetical protein